VVRKILLAFGEAKPLPVTTRTRDNFALNVGGKKMVGIIGRGGQWAAARREKDNCHLWASQGKKLEPDTIPSGSFETVKERWNGNQKEGVWERGSLKPGAKTNCKRGGTVSSKERAKPRPGEGSEE